VEKEDVFLRKIKGFTEKMSMCGRVKKKSPPFCKGKVPRKEGGESYRPIKAGSDRGILRKKEKIKEGRTPPNSPKWEGL